MEIEPIFATEPAFAVEVLPQSMFAAQSFAPPFNADSLADALVAGQLSPVPAAPVPAASPNCWPFWKPGMWDSPPPIAITSALTAPSSLAKLFLV